MKLDKNLVMNNLKGHSGSSDLSSKPSKVEDGAVKKKVHKQDSKTDAATVFTAPVPMGRKTGAKNNPQPRDV